MSLTPTTSGQYGFNGQLNVLGTVSTPAITLNGTDLQTTLNTISSGGSELENGLLDGTIVPLRSTNADHTKITVAGTDNTNYSIPFGSADASGNGSLKSGELFYNPNTKTMTVRNITMYNKIETPTLKTGDLNINDNGNIILGVNAKIYATGNPSNDLQTQINNNTSSLATKVDLSSAQTISGAKTFSALATFNGGISLPSTATDNNSGALIVGGSFTANGISNFFTQANFNSSVQFQLPTYISYQLDASRNYYPNSAVNISCSTASTNCYMIDALSGNSTKLFYKYCFVNTTFTSSTAVLVLPPANVYFNGTEFTFIQYGTPAPLALSTPAGTFNISNAPFSSNYVLPSSWYKVSFVCLPDPTTSGAGTTYFWLQTFYQ